MSRRNTPLPAAFARWARNVPSSASRCLCVFAVLDESTPELPSGVAYVLSGVVLVADEARARQAARAALPPDRRNPFHWHREGPAARAAMMLCLIEVGAVAHVYVHYPTARRRQERARAISLAALVPDLVAEGAEHLCIESRGAAADVRDRVTLLDALNPDGGVRTLTYDWRTKDEPALWLADAVCGATSDFLRGSAGKLKYFRELREAGVVDGLTYVDTQA